MENELKEYVVDVQRISYASHTITIKATSHEKAQELAIDYVSENIEMKESSSEYTIGFCEEK